VLLSRQADCAVRLVLELALCDPEQAQVKEVARRHRLPEAYLQKVVQRLVQAGLVRTMRGPHGGVRLSRPPSTISLRDVVEALEGPVVFNRCQNWPEECSDEKPCRTHAVWEGLASLLTQAMDAITFADLVTGQAAGKLARVEVESLGHRQFRHLPIRGGDRERTGQGTVGGRGQSERESEVYG